MSESEACDRNIRHDLRTPLNHIIGYTEMLMDEVPDRCADTLSAALKTLVASAYRLLDTINRPTVVQSGPLDTLFPDWREKMLLIEADFAAMNQLIDAHWEDGRSDADKVGSAVHNLHQLFEQLGRRPVIELISRSAKPCPPPENSPYQTGRAEGHLLLVDDRPENLEMMQRRLIREGYRVSLCTNGKDALERIQTEEFDVVLLDWLMPDLSGLEVLDRIRSQYSAHELPVIIVTARHGSEVVVEALSHGANDYVGKPLDFPVVLARIATQVYSRKITKQLAEANRQLKQFSYVDGLTAIANRRKFDEYLQTVWRRSQQDGTPVGMILMDVDSFKKYNDSLGHESGDQALIQVAEAIRSSLYRAKDLAARYGGEEFAVILPETTLQDAKVIAERIRQAVHALGVPHPASDAAEVVTISLGIGEWHPTAFCEPAALINLADRGLYTAKSAGRNQVGHLPPN